MAFWKPGQSAPGISLERSGEESNVIGYNPKANLSIQQQSASLPIARVKPSILYAVEKYKTLVIVGETGSGKSTQLPQYLYAGGWSQGGRVILCTQPRRLAATTVAARVALEMGTQLGLAVGYAVRFDQKCDMGSERTAIKFVSDGLLLRETLFDPLLSTYSVIILDEAHERSIYTDILLGLLKKVRRKRPDLRIIVSSATADAEAFKQYFEPNISDDPGKDEATILSITGRQFEVDVLYAVKPAVNYIQAAVECVINTIRSEGPGDILAFLPGMEEIDQAVSKTKEYLLETGEENTILVLPLYSSLPQHLQMKALGPAARYVTRKVIYATNIAETSVTINGVRFIIDSGFVKLPIYDVSTGFESLTIMPISKASAAQRAGRAGRTMSGKCFRLYTEVTFKRLQDHTMPEIQRSNLAWMILQLKALGIDEVMTFDFISQPSVQAMIRGLELLFALGALDDKCQLTQGLGEKMAEFPVEPRLSKILLSSFDFRCTEEVLTVVALLQVQNLWTNPRGRDSKEAQEEAMSELAQLEGDHLTLANIYTAYMEAGMSPEWCQSKFLNYRSLVRATEIRNQLKKYMERYRSKGSQMLSCCEDTETFRRCIVSGFFFNAARLKSDGRYYTVRGDHPVLLHPTSTLAKYGAPPEWVIFHDVVLTTHEYLRDVTKIRPQWLMEQAPHFYQFRGSEAFERSLGRKGR